MTGGEVHVSFPLSLHVFLAIPCSRGVAPSPKLTLPTLCVCVCVCVCVYFSAKLRVLPEEREVGVLIYSSAAKAALQGAVWEACNMTSFY